MMVGVRTRWLLIAVTVAVLCMVGVGAKTQWNDPNPNPGWDKYYGAWQYGRRAVMMYGRLAVICNGGCL